MSGWFSDSSQQSGAKHQTAQGIRTGQFETRRARQDAADALPSAINAATAGVQQGLNVLGQTIPGQFGAFSQGNVGAQQQILAGMPMHDAAIRGQDIDYSSLQPVNINYDTSWAQQTLPASITNPDYLAVLAQDQPINPFMDEEYVRTMLDRRARSKALAGGGGSTGGGTGGLPSDGPLAGRRGGEYSGKGEYE